MAVPAPPPPTDPAEEYGRRLARQRAREAAAAAAAARLETGRLGAFFLALGAAAGALWAGWSWALLAPPAALFVGLVLAHGAALRRRFDAARTAAHHERGLARIGDQWAGSGETGEAFRPPGHPYADDLDLFGPGSLFQLLSTARTRAGQRRLAEWLLRPADPATARCRQEAVSELRGALDLREDLAVLGGEVATALDRETATAWGSAPVRLRGRAGPAVFLVSGLVSAALLVGWLAAGWSVLLLATWLAVQFALALPVGRRVAAVLAEAERPARELDLLARLLERVERLPVAAPWLVRLRAALETDGVPPSQRIRDLTRRMSLVDARRNQVFLPVSGLLALGPQLAFALERWRADYGPDLLRWVDALAEFEAVLALSAYAYEHPADPFPELLDHEAVFDGRGLGHPLLPRATCVPNDLALDRDPATAAPQALVVSGSNMSGKSTLLRAVGVAVVLARAGAPVRATSLRLGPLRIGATLRIQDSLQAGASRFYAEIERLRQIVDLARGPEPALFLLDEILHGTNSHDRRIGAEAVVRSLLDAGAIGLVTTHDLALTAIAEGSGRLANVHFEDHLEEGRMVFDYRMRPGVVARSNALGLMRAVGLEV